MGLKPGLKALLSALRLIDQIPEILREIRVTIASGLGSNLHRDRVEPLFVSVCVASNERFDMVCVGHG